MKTNLEKFNNNSNNSEEKFTSLFLVDEINKFREAEGNISAGSYTTSQKKQAKMYELDYEQFWN